MRILFVLLLLTSMSCFSQNSDSFHIVGTVYDSSDLSPINNVAVVLMQKNDTVEIEFTDSNGIFIFDNLYREDYKVFFSHFAYYKYLKRLSLTSSINDLNVFLESSSFNLNTVEIISSSKKKSRMVGSFSKLGSREMKQISPIGTQEILSYLPGVNSFSDDGIGQSRISIGIRGINPRRSSRTLILEDGIPVQPALYVYSNMYYNPPVERIEEIELVKGGSSIEFGPHTMGGVINYKTKRPSDSLNGKLAVTAGSYSYLSSILEIGGFGNEVFKPEFQFIYKKGDGFRQNNDFTQYNGTFKLLVNPNKKRRIYINLNANNEVSNATYTGLTEYSFDSNYQFNPKNNDMFYVNRYSASAIQQKIISKKWEENTKLYFNYFSRDWWREYDMFVSEQDYLNNNIIEIDVQNTVGIDDLIRVGNGLSNFGILRDFAVAGIDQQYLYKHRINDTIFGSLKIGARFHFERFKDNAANGDSPTARTGSYYRANNYETYAYSFFIKEELNIGDFLLVPGIRAELFEQEMVNLINNNRYDDAIIFEVLPGIGFNYKINKLDFFGGIHKGMTPPSNGTLLTLNFGNTAGTDFENLNLESETSINSEFGIRTNQKNFSFEITGFNISIQNMIAAARGTQFTNLDRVSSKGLELFSNIYTSNYISWLPDFFIGYTYLETEIHDGILRFSALSDTIIPDVSGNELPYAPNHNLIVGLSLNIKSKFSFMINHQYVSRSYSDYENIEYIHNRGDTGPIPSYWLLNSTISYNPSNKVSFSISGKNLLDRKYIGSRIHSNPRQRNASSSSGIIPGLGRQIFANLTFKF